MNRRRVEAVRSTSGDLETMTLLGVQLSRGGHHQEALSLLGEVVEQSDTPAAQAGANANLGMALLAADDLDGALAAFGRTLDIEPRSAAASCGLGLAFQRQGRLEEAVEAFRATEELAPDNPAGPLNLALALESLGERGEACRALLRAAALAPEDLEIRRTLDHFVGARTPGVALDPSISGDLTIFGLFDLLEFLRVQSKSGSLVVSGREGTGMIRLWRGAIIDASAPEAPPGLERSSRVLFRQILDAVAALESWVDGAFSFHPEDDKTPPPVSFSVQQVVLELMRRRDEAGEERPVAESGR
jgi:tetratricopeptide (TPR) repeat protein